MSPQRPNMLRVKTAGRPTNAVLQRPQRRFDDVMISRNSENAEISPETESSPPVVALVRYGVVPQIARFTVSSDVLDSMTGRTIHGVQVVVATERGIETGQLLEIVGNAVASPEKAVTGQLLRISNSADQDEFLVNRQNADHEFFDWQVRVRDWGLELQLIDLEWTLDRQSLILYVLNGQNAETTRLALLAAAAGLGIVHVQPVEADGIVHQTSGGGCGNGGGGCGSGGCGT